MRITFCLPEISTVPTGGYKIIFEYANRLSERGHEITLVFLTNNVWNRVTKNCKIKSIVGNIRGKKNPSWFKLKPTIRKIMTPYLDGRDFPEADFIFATAVTTANIVKEMPEKYGKKCYLIQGFETWLLPESKVIETYNYGFLNITVSKWLCDIVQSYTETPVFCVSNPIDTEIFYLLNPIEKRNPFHLGMLYHEGEHKGISYAIDAIKKVKKIYPEIEVNIFGVPSRPVFLPEYFNYTQQATQQELQKIYNDTSIFLCATIDEGFGLTGAESMACGCALVSTAYSGVFEYAIDGENALLSPIKDSVSLATNITKLIRNHDLRLSIATQATKDMKKRGWEKTTLKLENILSEFTNF